MKSTIIKNDRHFHELRRGRGGSSEAPALYGRGYENLPSAWSLWAFKSGKLDMPEIDDDPRVRIGKRMEAVIAAEVAHQTGWDLRTQIEDKGHSARQLYVEHPDPALKMGCVVDRYVIEHEDGIGLIECKNRDYLQWVNQYTDDDPSARDLIQLCHQFACHPDVQWGVIAVLIGGNTLKLYPIKRADVLDGIADVEARWADLWRRVKDGDEPELTGDEVPDWLRVHEEKLLATDETDVIEIRDPGLGATDIIAAEHGVSPPKTFDQYVEDYKVASERRKEYEKIEKDAKAHILQRIGEHGVGQSNRFRVGLKFSHVKASMVTLPAGVQTEIAYVLDGELPSKARDVLGKLIDWHVVTRKAGVRVTMNIADAIRPETHRDATPEALKRAMDFQAPLKMKGPGK